jgi:predicted PurR-regulated permease PerM
MPTFNDRLRQIILLALIILIGFLLMKELYIFLPGVLGAVTTYILTRGIYFRLTLKHNWKKGPTAILFIVVALALIAIPIGFVWMMISPRINAIIHNPEPIVAVLKDLSHRMEAATGASFATPENIQTFTKRVSEFLPRLLNSTASMLTNMAMMFFLLYFLLYSGRDMESYLSRVIPLKPGNIQKLARETKLMIRANALGIPLISVIQGLFAALGYWIFGVKDWALWGMITGIFAFFPVVGTMIIWVPLCISVYAAGHIWPSLALTLYSLLVTGNVDYLARITLMKKLGDVHPVVTVIGVIVGLGLFGFMGLIFGPLLVSYFLILVKIYANEFSTPAGEDSAK